MIDGMLPFLMSILILLACSFLSYRFSEIEKKLEELRKSMEETKEILKK